jgi:hypothetical protein
LFYQLAFVHFEIPSEACCHKRIPPVNFGLPQFPVKTLHVPARKQQDAKHTLSPLLAINGNSVALKVAMASSASADVKSRRACWRTVSVTLIS